MTYSEKLRLRRHGIILPTSPFTTTVAKRVCAWCGEVIEDGAEPATHGICDECYRKEMG